MLIRITHKHLLICLLVCLSLTTYGQRHARARTAKIGSRAAKKTCFPAEITASKTVLCTGETLDLRSNILPSYKYRWFKNGSVIVGETAYLLTVSTPGTYRLEVTNTATAGCVETDEVTIRQSNLNRLSILPLTQSAACEGEPLVAAIEAGTTEPVSGSLTYNWQRNGLSLPGNSPTIVASQPGFYSVFVLDADCEVSAGPVRVFAKPTPQFPVIPAVCAASVDQLTLTATPAGGVFSGIGVQNGQFFPGQAGNGTHTVTYSVTNTAGCQATVNQTVQVINVPQPDLGASQTIIAGMRVTLQGPTDPNLTYTWDPITGLLINGDPAPGDERLNLPRVTAQPNITTTYRLTVSQNGQCPLTSSVDIIVLPGLFFPTAFTPNGDGQNDVWALTGIEAYPSCSVKIYNRWGELIVNQSPYTQPWDGRVDGEAVAPGPYQYVISPAPFLPDRSGTLTVLR
ncbi:gliding motility-associated C-terminal domain-containing protein [Fibrella aquatica]|uniref:T9SS type B sorting domain-containing protein n=1 Tax=Fibrella aquatica TaxID=3242487 RepID=UPI0035214502